MKQWCCYNCKARALELTPIQLSSGAIEIGPACCRKIHPPLSRWQRSTFIAKGSPSLKRARANENSRPPSHSRPPSLHSSPADRRLDSDTCLQSSSLALALQVCHHDTPATAIPSTTPLDTQYQIQYLKPAFFYLLSSSPATTTLDISR